MKTNYHISLFLIFLTGCLASCIDTITIDAEDESFLVVNCELTKGNPKVIAYVSTSNNLNGTQPITKPEDAIINISLGTEDRLRLEYDENEQYYTNEDPLDWSRVKNFRLNASVPGSIYPEASSKVEIVKPNIIKNIVSGPQGKIILDDKEYFQRTVTIELDTPLEFPAYYELRLTEKLTVTGIVDGQEILIEKGDGLDIDHIEVLTGSAGILNMEHRCGILIDHSRLNDNNELSFLLTSPHPIESTDQVFSKITTFLGAISKAHYHYHKAKSKTVNSANDLFIDRPIWGTNITNGFGLFSSTTQTINEFEL